MSNATIAPTKAACVDELVIDPDTAPDTALMLLLFLGLAAACDAQDMKRVVKQPKPILIVLLFQYGVMPLLAYLFGMAGDMSPEFKIAFIIALAAPGGAISNIIAAAYQADINLSVGITGISCLLGIGLMPLNQYIYVVGAQVIPLDSDFCVKFLGIVWAAAIVVIGIVAGIAIKYVLQRFKCYRAIKAVYAIGSLAGLAIMIKGIVANSTSAIPWWELPPKTFGCIIAPAFIGPTIIWFVGAALKIPGPTRLTMFLEVGIQNMPVSMAAIMFVLPVPQAYAALALPMCYQMICMCYLIVMSYIAWKLGYTNLDRNKNFIAAWREGKEERAARQRRTIYGDDEEAAEADRKAAAGETTTSNEEEGSQDVEDNNNSINDKAPEDELEAGKKPQPTHTVATV